MKTIISFVIFISIVYTSIAQDAINWYRDWNNSLIDESQDPLDLPLWTPYYKYYITQIDQHYSGEYLIAANDLPWAAYRLDNILSPLIGNGLYVTHQVELASFPFTPECAFPSVPSTGCLNSPQRHLIMPLDIDYDHSIKSWQFNSSNPNLYNVSQEDLFEINNFNPSYPDYISSQTNPYSLSSQTFNRNGGWHPDRVVLPHSILKHTLRLKCGVGISATTISQIVFYVDLTRGMMREYPFTPVNSGTIAIVHDVTVMPGIATGFNGDYNQTDFCDYGEAISGFTDCGRPSWKGNTINYTPFDVMSDDILCTSIIPSTSTVLTPNDGYFSGGSNELSGINRLPIPNYSMIVSTGIRGIDAKYPAGYYAPAGSAFLDKISPAPFVHQYFIDKEISLEKINPSERVIYNPSEVHITAPIQKFPSHYTFKTIRGKYPYLSDVLSENTVKNGGPYDTTDPTNPNYVSKLNVTTDLHKDWHVSNTYPDLDPKYSSIYHLDAPCKLVIQPCVRIFDATFEVNTGSEIVFENWSTNQINVERYQLLFNGGIVTKFDENFLFQNGNEDNKILHYNAGNSILVGEDVDINKPPGVYRVLSGSEVEYVANNFISFENGFDSESGAFLDASIVPVTIPACPPVPPLRIGRDNSNNPSTEIQSSNLLYFECTPNPINENSVLMFKIDSASYVSLHVYNSQGQLIATICDEKQLLAGSYSYNLNKTDFKSGIYYAKLGVNFDTKSLKFIKP